MTQALLVLLVLLVLRSFPFMLQVTLRCRPTHVYWTEGRPASKCLQDLPGFLLRGKPQHIRRCYANSHRITSCPRTAAASTTKMALDRHRACRFAHCRCWHSAYGVGQQFYHDAKLRTELGSILRINLDVHRGLCQSVMCFCTRYQTIRCQDPTKDAWVSFLTKSYADDWTSGYWYRARLWVQMEKD